MRGRPRFAGGGPSAGTASGVHVDLSGDDFLTYLRFLTPVVSCSLAGARSLVFSTWLARVASLNALGAVAGAGVRVSWGAFRAEVLRARFFGGTAGVDGTMGGVANDVVVEAVVGKNALGFAMLIELGCGPPPG